MDIINMTPVEFTKINKLCSGYCLELYNQVELRIINTEIKLFMNSDKLSFNAFIPNADNGIIVSIPYDINEYCDKFGFKIETNMCDIYGNIIYDNDIYPDSYRWVGINEIINEILYICS